MSDQATRANASATELERLDHWIEGASAQPATGDYIETVSPMTGAAHLRVAAGDAGDVARAVAAAEAARDGWRRFPRPSAGG